MNTYHLPKTDLRVSRLAFGTWHLGGSWDSAPLADEFKTLGDGLIHRAVDLGINHIDLADIYTRGKSDEVVGHALKQDPGLRDRVVLQAKTGIILEDPAHPDLPGRYDFSYEHLVAGVNSTLQRLGTDRVELLAFHRPDALAEPEEVARAADDLHRAGKVRYFGVSNHNWAQIALLAKHMRQPLVLNQVEISLGHHHLISEGLVFNNEDVPHTSSLGTLDYCRSQDMLLQAWSPVARGSIFSTESHPRLAALLAQLAEQYSTTNEAIAVAWLLRHPAPIQPILGTQSVDRLSRTTPADEVELSRVDWYQLLEAARGVAVP